MDEQALPETAEAVKKKARKRRPSIRARKALILLGENGGNARKALKDAGYSQKVADNPNRVIKSDAFQQLVEQQLPDSLLVRVHKEGLTANRVVSARVTNKEAGVDTDDFIEVPDHAVRHKFLVTGYELKKKLERGNNVFMPIQFNVGDDRQSFA